MPLVWCLFASGMHSLSVFWSDFRGFRGAMVCFLALRLNFRHSTLDSWHAVLFPGDGRPFAGQFASRALLECLSKLPSVKHKQCFLSFQQQNPSALRRKYKAYHEGTA